MPWEVESAATFVKSPTVIDKSATAIDKTTTVIKLFLTYGLSCWEEVLSWKKIVMPRERTEANGSQLLSEISQQKAILTTKTFGRHCLISPASYQTCRRAICRQAVS